MRRLWSHIILAATSLVMVGATFATVVTNINSNIEFTSIPGRELVFRVVEKDADGNPDEAYEFKDDEAVKEIASIMEERLKNAEISRYEVDVQGYDTIKVSFFDQNDQYENIKNYLSFNATLAISNSKGTYALLEFVLVVEDIEQALPGEIRGGPGAIAHGGLDGFAFQAAADDSHNWTTALK